MLEKKVLTVKLFAHIVRLYCDVLRRAINRKTRSLRYRSSPAPSAEQTRSIVIVGASFAGYHAARLIATSLPPNSPFKIVIIEPNTHFQFTWLLPRFCVISGHEHKAFIPYGPYLDGSPVQWIRDRVQSIENKCILLQSGEKVPYEFLVVATGSAQGGQLPSRVGTPGKPEGIKLLQEIQQRIKQASSIVVVGGGAAGVELAADAKEEYPEKTVVLVHSREGVMNRFESGLQDAALKALQNLGVEVILKERVVHEVSTPGHITLTSGRVLQCDYLVNCTGQKPASHLLSTLTPQTISESGHIRVHPTMQIADDQLPNIYACGDVAHTGVPKPNARSAMHQAAIVADNLVLAAMGKTPKHKYTPHWADGVIKLTLGLSESITHFGDGKTELLFPAKEKDLALMAEGAWRGFGAMPFEEPDLEAGSGK